MITIKIMDLVNGTPALQKLADAPLKAKLAWQISRILKVVDTEMQSFNETRMQLINKYGEKDESGELITDEQGNCRIMPDKLIDFTNEINELVSTEIEINANKIKMENLDDVNFTPGEMATLEPFIEIDDIE